MLLSCAFFFNGFKCGAKKEGEVSDSGRGRRRSKERRVIGTIEEEFPTYKVEKNITMQLFANSRIIWLDYS